MRITNNNNKKITRQRKVQKTIPRRVKVRRKLHHPTTTPTTRQYHIQLSFLSQPDAHYIESNSFNNSKNNNTTTLSSSQQLIFNTSHTNVQSIGFKYSPLSSISRRSYSSFNNTHNKGNNNNNNIFPYHAQKKNNINIIPTLSGTNHNHLDLTKRILHRITQRFAHFRRPKITRSNTRRPIQRWGGEENDNEEPIDPLFDESGNLNKDEALRVFRTSVRRRKLYNKLVNKHTLYGDGEGGSHNIFEEQDFSQQQQDGMQYIESTPIDESNNMQYQRRVISNPFKLDIDNIDHKKPHHHDKFDDMEELTLEDRAILRRLDPELQDVIDLTRRMLLLRHFKGPFPIALDKSDHQELLQCFEVILQHDNIKTKCTSQFLECYNIIKSTTTISRDIWNNVLYSLAQHVEMYQNERITNLNQIRKKESKKRYKEDFIKHGHIQQFQEIIKLDPILRIMKIREILEKIPHNDVDPAIVQKQKEIQYNLPLEERMKFYQELDYPAEIRPWVRFLRDAINVAEDEYFQWQEFTRNTRLMETFPGMDIELLLKKYQDEKNSSSSDWQDCPPGDQSPPQALLRPDTVDVTNLFKRKGLQHLLKYLPTEYVKVDKKTGQPLQPGHELIFGKQWKYQIQCKLPYEIVKLIEDDAFRPLTPQQTFLWRGKIKKRYLEEYNQWPWAKDIKDIVDITEPRLQKGLFDINLFNDPQQLDEWGKKQKFTKWDPERLEETHRLLYLSLIRAGEESVGPDGQLRPNTMRHVEVFKNDDGIPRDPHCWDILFDILDRMRYALVQHGIQPTLFPQHLLNRVERRMKHLMIKANIIDKKYDLAKKQAEEEVSHILQTTPLTPDTADSLRHIRDMPIFLSDDIDDDEGGNDDNNDTKLLIDGINQLRANANGDNVDDMRAAEITYKAVLERLLYGDNSSTVPKKKVVTREMGAWKLDNNDNDDDKPNKINKNPFKLHLVEALTNNYGNTSALDNNKKTTKEQWEKMLSDMVIQDNSVIFCGKRLNPSHPIVKDLVAFQTEHKQQQAEQQKDQQPHVLDLTSLNIQFQRFLEQEELKGNLDSLAKFHLNAHYKQFYEHLEKSTIPAEKWNFEQFNFWDLLPPDNTDNASPWAEHGEPDYMNILRKYSTFFEPLPGIENSYNFDTLDNAFLRFKTQQLQQQSKNNNQKKLTKYQLENIEYNLLYFKQHCAIFHTTLIEQNVDGMSEMKKQESFERLFDFSKLNFFTLKKWYISSTEFHSLMESSTTTHIKIDGSRPSRHDAILKSPTAQEFLQHLPTLTMGLKHSKRQLKALKKLILEQQQVEWYKEQKLIESQKFFNTINSSNFNKNVEEKLKDDMKRKKDFFSALVYNEFEIQWRRERAVEYGELYNKLSNIWLNAKHHLKSQHKRKLLQLESPVSKSYVRQRKIEHIAKLSWHGQQRKILQDICKEKLDVNLNILFIGEQNGDEKYHIMHDLDTIRTMTPKLTIGPNKGKQSYTLDGFKPMLLFNEYYHNWIQDHFLSDMPSELRSITLKVLSSRNDQELYDENTYKKYCEGNLLSQILDFEKHIPIPENIVNPIEKEQIFKKRKALANETLRWLFHHPQGKDLILFTHRYVRFCNILKELEYPLYLFDFTNIDFGNFIQFVDHGFIGDVNFIADSLFQERRAKYSPDITDVQLTDTPRLLALRYKIKLRLDKYINYTLDDIYNNNSNNRNNNYDNKQNVVTQKINNLFRNNIEFQQEKQQRLKFSNNELLNDPSQGALILALDVPVPVWTFKLQKTIKQLIKDKFKLPFYDDDNIDIDEPYDEQYNHPMFLSLYQQHANDDDFHMEEEGNGLITKTTSYHDQRELYLLQNIIALYSIKRTLPISYWKSLRRIVQRETLMIAALTASEELNNADKMRDEDFIIIEHKIKQLPSPQERQRIQRYLNEFKNMVKKSNISRDKWNFIKFDLADLLPIYAQDDPLHNYLQQNPDNIILGSGGHDPDEISFLPGRFDYAKILNNYTTIFNSTNQADVKDKGMYYSFGPLVIACDTTLESVVQNFNSYRLQAYSGLHEQIAVLDRKHLTGSKDVYIPFSHGSFDLEKEVGMEIPNQKKEFQKFIRKIDNESKTKPLSTLQEITAQVKTLEERIDFKQRPQTYDEYIIKEYNLTQQQFDEIYKDEPLVLSQFRLSYQKQLKKQEEQQKIIKKLKQALPSGTPLTMNNEKLMLSPKKNMEIEQLEQRLVLPKNKKDLEIVKSRQVGTLPDDITDVTPKNAAEYKQLQYLLNGSVVDNDNDILSKYHIDWKNIRHIVNELLLTFDKQNDDADDYNNNEDNDDDTVFHDFTPTSKTKNKLLRLKRKLLFRQHNFTSHIQNVIETSATTRTKEINRLKAEFDKNLKIKIRNEAPREIDLTKLTPEEKQDYELHITQINNITTVINDSIKLIRAEVDQVPEWLWDFKDEDGLTYRDYYQILQLHKKYVVNQPHFNRHYKEDYPLVESSDSEDVDGVSRGKLPIPKSYEEFRLRYPDHPSFDILCMQSWQKQLTSQNRQDELLLINNNQSKYTEEERLKMYKEEIRKKEELEKNLKLAKKSLPQLNEGEKLPDDYEYNPEPFMNKEELQITRAKRNLRIIALIKEKKAKAQRQAYGVDDDDDDEIGAGIRAEDQEVKPQDMPKYRWVKRKENIQTGEAIWEEERITNGYLDEADFEEEDARIAEQKEIEEFEKKQNQEEKRKLSNTKYRQQVNIEKLLGKPLSGNYTTKPGAMLELYTIPREQLSKLSQEEQDYIEKIKEEHHISWQQQLAVSHLLYRAMYKTTTNQYANSLYIKPWILAIKNWAKEAGLDVDDLDNTTTSKLTTHDHVEDSLAVLNEEYQRKLKQDKPIDIIKHELQNNPNLQKDQFFYLRKYMKRLGWPHDKLPHELTEHGAFTIWQKSRKQILTHPAAHHLLECLTRPIEDEIILPTDIPPAQRQQILQQLQTDHTRRLAWAFGLDDPEVWSPEELELLGLKDLADATQKSPYHTPRSPREDPRYVALKRNEQQILSSAKTKEEYFRLKQHINNMSHRPVEQIKAELKQQRARDMYQQELRNASRKGHFENYDDSASPARRQQREWAEQQRAGHAQQGRRQQQSDDDDAAGGGGAGLAGLDPNSKEFQNLFDMIRQQPGAEDMTKEEFIQFLKHLQQQQQQGGGAPQQFDHGDTGHQQQQHNPYSHIGGYPGEGVDGDFDPEQMYDDMQSGSGDMDGSYGGGGGDYEQQYYGYDQQMGAATEQEYYDQQQQHFNGRDPHGRGSGPGQGW